MNKAVIASFGNRAYEISQILRDSLSNHAQSPLRTYKGGQEQCTHPELWPQHRQRLLDRLPRIRRDAGQRHQLRAQRPPQSTHFFSIQEPNLL